MATEFSILDLGRRLFAEVHAEMLALHERVRTGASDGEVWLAEHDPVYTAGRATPADVLQDATIVPIERGGQVTYHGPGQLVVYPILRLPKRDVRDWLRRIESFGVAICAGFGLAGIPSVDGTGVFVETRKVASIGVAIRSWINLHGIAINIDMDLQPFFAIRPCGLDPTIMTDLTRETGGMVSLEASKEQARLALTCLLD